MVYGCRYLYPQGSGIFNFAFPRLKRNTSISMDVHRFWTAHRQLNLTLFFNSLLFETEKNIRLDNICRGWYRLEDEPFQFMEHLTIFRLRSLEMKVLLPGVGEIAGKLPWPSKKRILSIPKHPTHLKHPEHSCFFVEMRPRSKLSTRPSAESIFDLKPKVLTSKPVDWLTVLIILKGKESSRYGRHVITFVTKNAKLWR